MDTGTQLAKYLLDIGAIKLQPRDPFTWASGLRSPIYCDNRTSLSYPHVRNYIKDQLAELSKKFDFFDAIAGVATAGIPHATLLADKLNLPLIYVRSKAKDHGRQNLIEGDYSKCKQVLVVEDLISTGGSSLQAVDALKDQGIAVSGVIALFSYQLEASKKAFEKANCPLDTISNYAILLEEALHSKFINADDYTVLQEWNKDPKAWSDRF